MASQQRTFVVLLPQRHNDDEYDEWAWVMIYGEDQARALPVRF